MKDAAHAKPDGNSPHLGLLSAAHKIVIHQAALNEHSSQLSSLQLEIKFENRECARAGELLIYEITAITNPALLKKCLNTFALVTKTVLEPLDKWIVNPTRGLNTRDWLRSMAPFALAKSEYQNLVATLTNQTEREAWTEVAETWEKLNRQLQLLYDLQNEIISIGTTLQDYRIIPPARIERNFKIGPITSFSECIIRTSVGLFQSPAIVQIAAACTDSPTKPGAMAPALMRVAQDFQRLLTNSEIRCFRPHFESPTAKNTEAEAQLLQLVASYRDFFGLLISKPNQESSIEGMPQLTVKGMVDRTPARTSDKQTAKSTAGPGNDSKQFLAEIISINEAKLDGNPVDRRAARSLFILACDTSNWNSSLIQFNPIIFIDAKDPEGTKDANRKRWYVCIKALKRIGIPVEGRSPRCSIQGLKFSSPHSPEDLKVLWEKNKVV